VEYAIIIPAKNEEESIPLVLDSIVSQTLLPQIVLVVDDGSTDHTAGVVQSYTSAHGFIKCLKKQDQDKGYHLGGKVVEVFHYGINYLNKLGIDYEFVLKMDADVQFDSGLFSQIAERIKHISKPGILSCTPYVEQNDSRIHIHSPHWHTNGDFKIYNRACLEHMGGLVPDLGWDCADNIMAMENGWNTHVYRDLTYRQNRPIGRNSIKKGIMRQGVGAYKLRYSSLYILLKIIHDMVKPPFLIYGYYYLMGYFQAKRNAESRTLNKVQAKILRSLLWQSMRSRIQHKEFQIFQRGRYLKKATKTTAG